MAADRHRGGGAGPGPHPGRVAGARNSSVCSPLPSFQGRTTNDRNYLPADIPGQPRLWRRADRQLQQRPGMNPEMLARRGTEPRCGATPPTMLVIDRIAQGGVPHSPAIAPPCRPSPRARLGTPIEHTLDTVPDQHERYEPEDDESLHAGPHGRHAQNRLTRLQSTIDTMTKMSNITKEDGGHHPLDGHQDERHGSSTFRKFAR